MKDYTVEPLKQHTADADAGNYSELKFSDLVITYL